MISDEGSGRDVVQSKVVESFLRKIVTGILWDVCVCVQREWALGRKGTGLVHEGFTSVALMGFWEIWVEVGWIG